MTGDFESQEFRDAVLGLLDEQGITGSRLVGVCTGDPNGQVASNAGRGMFREDGGAGSTFYVKEADNVAGDATQGWAAK